jgi:hypothetical protein
MDAAGFGRGIVPGRSRHPSEPDVDCPVFFFIFSSSRTFTSRS